MTSGTRAARAADEQIKKVLEEVVSDSGLITDNRMAKFMTDLEANLESTLISEIEKVTKPLVNQVTALEAKVELYEAHFVELDSKIDPLESRVESLEKELEKYQEHLSKMEIKLDDSEQYSRRACLRLIGIPLPQDTKEAASECFKKVKEILGKLQVRIPDKSIDRAHRIGQVKEIKNDQGSPTFHQLIIIKFTNWSTRTAVYRARKTLNGPKIFLDLTSRRAKLLSSAVAQVESIDAVDYAFADINCRLGLKMTDESLHYFNTEAELEKLLE
eukprot:Seg6549.2_Seg6549.3 transcript_id=Seg6549.2_Seg6549.3/GoldUCD/mRNA.D3Y31 product="hypothetical protein" protein_id=Seg6549.2_Seg6549.3/GoldUCD/D3Y31